MKNSYFAFLLLAMACASAQNRDNLPGVKDYRINIPRMGIETRVLEYGDPRPGKPSLLFLHGNPEDVEEWALVMNLMKADFHCVALDLPGYGRSTEPPVEFDYSTKAQTAFLNAFLEEKKIPGKFILVMHDTGAVMGIPWASENPDRLKAAVITNTVAFKDFEWFQAAKNFGDEDSPRWQAFKMKVLPRWVFRRIIKRDAPQLPESELDRMSDAFPSNSIAKASTLRQFRKMTKPDFFDDYANLLQTLTKNVPTVVVWGLGDSYVPDKYADAFASARVVKLENVGHWVPTVAPEQLADQIRLIAKK